MRTFGTRFGERMARPTGALELMADLGSAMARGGSHVHMLGGGNPARIAAVEAVYRRRLAEIAADPAQFGRFIAGYSAPAGDLGFREAVALSLRNEFGWSVTAGNVGLTSGSQSAFFFLFNLFAGERTDGGHCRILLPLAPEYIGYADVGLTLGMLLAQPAGIHELDDGYFKYFVDFDRLDVPDDVGALCVSRPTNPSGNVLTLAELQRLDALARARRVPFIIDAAYGLPFPGIQHEHLDSLWNPNVVLCLSLSKLGLPAARSGELARLCRDHLRRLATANSPARRRVLPVAVVPGPADLERRALSAAEAARRARAVGAPFLPGRRARRSAPARMPAPELRAAARERAGRHCDPRRGSAARVRARVVADTRRSDGFQSRTP